jgi:hypothetical protein
MTERFCTSDRWTCPSCHRTVVVDAISPNDVAVAVRAVQERHATRHAQADRARHGDEPEPRQRGGNAGDVDRAGRRRPPRDRRRA